MILAVGCRIGVHGVTPLDELPVALVVLGTAGICLGAYALYRWVWRWRGTLVVAVFLLHVVSLSVLFLLAPQGSWAEYQQFWGFLVTHQMEMIWWDITHFDPVNIDQSLPTFLIYASILLATPHVLRPSILSSITSTVGVGLWFQISFVMMAQAA